MHDEGRQLSREIVQLETAYLDPSTGALFHFCDDPAPYLVSEPVSVNQDERRNDDRETKEEQRHEGVADS
jgi:hypothetical protein